MRCWTALWLGWGASALPRPRSVPGVHHRGGVGAPNGGPATRSVETHVVSVEERGAAAVESGEPSVLALLSRSAYLCVVFLPVTSSLWLAVLLPWFRRRLWYVWLRIALGNAGAAFVKWAQWSATRVDIFPEALCEQLGLLQSYAPSHSFAHTRRAVEESVGSTLEQYFDGGFERLPLASGSIAQVHRAKRRSTLLAVKVRHPRVARQLALDSRLMVRCAILMDRFVPPLRWLRLPESVQQFSGSLERQTDLAVEARELRGFSKRFSGRAWRDVGFPRPALATPSTLVESFESGSLVSRLVQHARKLRKGSSASVSRVDRERAAAGAYLVHRGEDVYLKMLLEDRVMHADLHPGNMLYSRARPTRDGARRVTLVDAGMVTRLTRGECDAFVGLIEALGASDSAAAARCVRAFEPSNAAMSASARAAFDADVALLFAAKCRGYGTGCDFGEILRGVLSLVREHRVRVGANYATLIINALCLDGMAHDLHPGYSVLDGARPLLSLHRFLCSSCGRRRLPFGHALFRYLFLPFAWRVKHVKDGLTQRSLDTAARSHEVLAQS